LDIWPKLPFNCKKEKEARVKCWLDRQREIYGGVMDIDLPISGCDAVSSGHQIFDEFGMV